MTNAYITNPSVRALLAAEIRDQRYMFQRLEAGRVRDYWRPHYLNRIQSYRLFAIATQGALRRGTLVEA